MFCVISKQPVCSIFMFYVIWGWNFDLFEPIRRFCRKRVASTKTRSTDDICCSCQSSFGKGRKRKLVDVCGHKRCYSCIIVSEGCPLCLSGGSPSAFTSTRRRPSFFSKFFSKTSNKKRHLEVKDDPSHKRLRLHNHLQDGANNSQNTSLHRRTFPEMDSKRFSTLTTSSFSHHTTIENNASLTEFDEKRKLGIKLKPLFFQVPEIRPENFFQGRQWLFKKIEQMLCDDNSGPLLIHGSPGTGKTSIILQLVQYSCFGTKRESLHMDMITSNVTENQLNIAKQLIAYHFCQKGNKYTNSIPEFVHNLAAQFCQAPPLLAYRCLVSRELRYQEMLSMESCINNPMTSFTQGVLEPLNFLKQSGKIPPFNYILLLDALDESSHVNGCDEKFKSFVLNIVTQFPRWIKVLLTSRASIEQINNCISLDEIKSNSNLTADIYSFVTKRIQTSPDIQSNIINNRIGKAGDFNSRFTTFLSTASQSSFLYAKTVLNLIERRHLVLKSESFRILPVGLDEVFLLNMNLKFSTSTSFEKVKPILEICLASTYPLTLLEVYHSLNCRYLRPVISWQEFLSHLDTLMSSDILCKRNDETLMFVHPSLVDWLENQNGKFQLDIRNGHIMIALRQCRLESPLESEKVLELAYHISSSEMFNNVPLYSENLSALCLLLSSTNINSAFGCSRNLSDPDIKVNHFLLKAKCDPNLLVKYESQSNILCCFSYRGYNEMVNLLIKFGADCNWRSKFGKTALHFAADQGHLSTVSLLVDYSDQVNCKDEKGITPLIQACAKGHTAVVNYLLSYYNTMNLSKLFEIETGIVSAVLGDHCETCKVLIESRKPNLNFIDRVTGETPLTAACTMGHINIVKLLMSYGGNITTTNKKKNPAIVCAVTEGHLEVVKYLLEQKGANKLLDSEGRTSLMIAAMKGYVTIMELLVSKGVLITTRDKNGWSALTWASTKGQIQAIGWLLERGADINGVDNHGRTPLSVAAGESSTEAIQMLLDNGADINHIDRNGLSPIDRALAISNVAAVSQLLQHGAKLGPQSWATANDRPEMIMLLLGKFWKEPEKSKKNEFRKSEEIRSDLPLTENEECLSYKWKTNCI